jgi:hypothetical protein
MTLILRDADGQKTVISQSDIIKLTNTCLYFKNSSGQKDSRKLNASTHQSIFEYMLNDSENLEINI